MAETDILNPQTGYWAALGDNPNPSYGFMRKTNSNSQLARARLGSWYQRDNANDGYAFSLSFVNRPWTTMLWLKKFYEIGKGGYFTLIDYDGGGRHHVGRFTTQPNPTQVENGKYNCEGLMFEEIPQARMVNYPADFLNWSRTINVVDDFLNLNVAYQGAWVLQVNPEIEIITRSNLVTLGDYELYIGTAVTTDFAQVQYVGFGFQMTFRLNAAFGGWDVVVDGQTLVTALNLVNGTSTALAGYLPFNGNQALAVPTLVASNVGAAAQSVLLTVAQMPLDIHRVKIVRNETATSGKPQIVHRASPNTGVGPNPPEDNGGLIGNLPAAFPAITVIV